MIIPGQLYVKSGSISPAKELCLFDLTGRPVLQRQNFPNGSSLDISRLPSGIYLLKLQFREGGYFYKEIIKR
jgi:Secretion system C-terminal sorting domain